MAFFYTVLLLVLVICVIDFSEKNDDFIKHNLSIWTVIGGYYANFFPYIANLVSPIFVFVSTIFVTARLASHTEIIAMLSAGISFKRILWTYAMGGIILGGVIFVIQGWVLPMANKNRVAFEAKYLDSSTEVYKSKHYILGNDVYAYAAKFRDGENTAELFTIEKMVNHRLKSKLYTNKAVWNPKRKSWKIKEYMLRTYTETGEKISYGENMDTILNLKPQDFVSSMKRREILTLGELNDVIKDIEFRRIEKIEPYLVEKYNRYAYPVAILILTLMAVIVSARKSRGGSGVQIFIGFLLAFAFVGAIYFIRLMSEGGDLSPMTGAIMPLVTFCVITLILYRTVPR